MRTSFLALLFLLTCIAVQSQTEKTDYKVYSYSELFKMIEDSEDSVFKLDNALIKYDSLTDFQHIELSRIDSIRSKEERKDSIFIDKQLKFNNVQFLGANYYRTDGTGYRDLPVLRNIVFRRKVEFNNTYLLFISNSSFQNGLYIRDYMNLFQDPNLIYEVLSMLPPYPDNPGLYLRINLNKIVASEFDLSNIPMIPRDSLLDKVNLRLAGLHVTESKFQNGFFIRNGINIFNVVEGNTFLGRSYIHSIKSRLSLENNHFNDLATIVLSDNSPNPNYKNSIWGNNFENLVFLTIDNKNITQLDWAQWFQRYGFKQNNTSIANAGEIKSSISREKTIKTTSRSGLPENLFTRSWASYDLLDSSYREFRSKLLMEDKREFNLAMEELKLYQDIFDNRNDIENSNFVYQEIKNLQTERLKFLYETEGGFNRYFSWKVNQFLEVFSDYGTNPAKSVTFAVNVILFFGFIYLFFPNSWDEKGKHRLLNRFRFYNRYLSAPNGMHEFYLKEKETDISNYEQFKEEISKSSLELPKFFIRWSQPIYHLSMINTRLSSRLLRSTDILSGKWIDLPPAKRRWKNIQIGTFLVLGLMWDLLVRVLNALMLSLNTFTTLGFGEIPIKGIPRYLAIIQGFIGWFMLTIFSVSLISQLLS